MNYYKRHIGDYMKDASHLSLLEHGVYMRLLDVYYTRESAIPVDQAARLIGARSKDEKEALSIVAGEFFTVVDGAYTQTRCEHEISAMLTKAETNREVGKRGGRPRKVTALVDSGNPEITQMVSFFNPDETLATNHKPLTNNQHTQTGGEQAPDGTGVPVCVSVCQKMQEAGVMDANSSDATLTTLIARGATVEAFVAAAQAAVLSEKGFAYAMGIVKNKMTAAAALAAAPLAAPAGLPAKADISRVTVESNPDVEATLRRFAADAAIPRSGPSPEQREQLARLRQGLPAAGAGVGA